MRFISTISILGLIGCSSIHDSSRTYYPNKFRENIAAANCEAAESQIPLEKDSTQFVRIYQGTIGYMAYASTVPFTVGVDLLLMGRCRFGCPSEEREKEFLELLFPTSTYTYEYTKGMRCPDTSYYAQKFLEVADCYERRGDEHSLKTVHQQLKFTEESFESGPSCMTVRDYQTIVVMRKRIEKKFGK